MFGVKSSRSKVGVLYVSKIFRLLLSIVQPCFSQLSTDNLNCTSLCGNE